MTDLTKMKKAELQEVCSQAGISFTEEDTKATLLEKIQEVGEFLEEPADTSPPNPGAFVPPSLEVYRFPVLFNHRKHGLSTGILVMNVSGAEEFIEATRGIRVALGECANIVPL